MVAVTAPVGSTDNRPRLLDWRTLWPLALAAVLCLLVVGQWLIGLGQRQPAIGDGERVASYGFDLSTCLVPRDLIAATGFPKDGVPALTDPNVFTRAEMEAFDKQMRKAHQGKFVVDHERVIGVVLGDEARAYPLRLLAWHQVINDRLGNVPIAVTYDPLCDSAIVFDRRSEDGRPMFFGISGLVYNSNLLMYDRDNGSAAESLWSQLQRRAIAGPAAERGDALTVLPFAVLPWGDWKVTQPGTTVLAPLRAWWKVYKRSYGAYYSRPDLHFPVAPLPPRDPRAWKTPMIVVRVGGQWQPLVIDALVAQAGGAGRCVVDLGGATAALECGTEPPTAWLVGDAALDTRAVYTFWFAWYAMEAGSERPGG